jgi:hypothetical protein
VSRASGVSRVSGISEVSGISGFCGVSGVSEVSEVVGISGARAESPEVKSSRELPRLPFSLSALLKAGPRKSCLSSLPPLVHSIVLDTSSLLDDFGLHSGVSPEEVLWGRVEGRGGDLAPRRKSAPSRGMLRTRVEARVLRWEVSSRERERRPRLKAWRIARPIVMS